VHFTPRRSWLSDSFVSGHTATMSIVAASLEAAAALVLAGAGVVALRRRRAVGGPGSTPPVSTRHGLRHPIVMVLILGNAVVLVGSFATR
jgi:hypothetical protein